MSSPEDELKKEIKKGTVPEDVAYAMRSHAKRCLQAVADEVEGMKGTIEYPKEAHEDIDHYKRGLYWGLDYAMKEINKHLSNE